MITRFLVLFLAALAGCGDKPQEPTSGSGSTVSTSRKSTPIPTDPNNIVSIASASADHTTLVAALQAADYVRSVANPGPLTVFAPTNAAFAKLPAGTLDELLKPEKVDDLREILKYHVTTTAYEQSALLDGMVLGMANGKKVTMHMVDGKLKVNDANVVASYRGSNGMVHVVDAVLLPPAQ